MVFVLVVLKKNIIKLFTELVISEDETDDIKGLSGKQKRRKSATKIVSKAYYLKLLLSPNYANYHAK